VFDGERGATEARTALAVLAIAVQVRTARHSDVETVRLSEVSSMALRGRRKHGAQQNALDF
jgi:hypothetical protein